MDFNKAIICGRVVRDPELRYLPNTGAPVASFSVATNRTWMDQNGEKQEVAEFHNIVVYGRQAEPCGQYLAKGQIVLLEGRIQTRSWDGQDKQKRYRTEIIAERVQFGPKRQGDAGEPDDYPSSSTKSAPAQDANTEANMDGQPDEQLTDDNIPF